MDAVRQLLLDLPSIVTGPAILAVVVGTLWGIVTGALPGVTGSVGTALLLPFTFTLPANIALVLLVGVGIGSAYSGSIPSILLRMPGEPSSAACMEDGYAVHKRGETGTALAMSLFPGTVASLIATLVFLFFSAALVDVALRISPADYFSLFVFAMAAMASFTGNNVGKGVVSVFLGLALAAVGTDTLSGAERLTFGFSEFRDGVPLLPVIVGLFAISQVLADVLLPEPRASGKDDRSFRQMIALPPLRAFRKVWRATAIGTGIGTILGILPGLGSTVASFVSYTESRRWSKTPEEFGHGSYEGIAAPESANNAVTPAALIPALALGIPGNGSAAMILIALVVHGFRPGPSLLDNSPQLLSAVFVGLVLSAIATIIFGMLLIPLWVWMVSIRKSILLPAIAILVTVGIYTSTGNLFDVWICYALGVLGFLMLRFEFPLIPTVIAFILGTLIEQSLRRALVLSDGSIGVFFTDRLSLFFLVLTVVMLVTTQWGKARARRRNLDGASSL